MRQSGTTLIELTIAMVILAMLMTAASVSYATLQARHAVTVASNNLLGLMYQARAYGMARGGAYLCDGERGCHEFDWTRHIIVTTSADPGATVIESARLPANVRVRWNGFRGTSLHYGPRGHTFFQNGHLLICHDTHRVPPRKIVVNWLGRPRIEAALPQQCNI